MPLPTLSDVVCDLLHDNPFLTPRAMLLQIKKMPVAGMLGTLTIEIIRQCREQIVTNEVALELALGSRLGFRSSIADLIRVAMAIRRPNRDWWDMQTRCYEDMLFGMSPTQVSLYRKAVAWVLLNKNPRMGDEEGLWGDTPPDCRTYKGQPRRNMKVMLVA